MNEAFFESRMKCKFCQIACGLPVVEQPPPPSSPSYETAARLIDHSLSTSTSGYLLPPCSPQSSFNLPIFSSLTAICFCSNRISNANSQLGQTNARFTSNTLQSESTGRSSKTKGDGFHTKEVWYQMRIGRFRL